MANRLVLTDSVDPWHNLALEEYLFDTQGEGATLYLWQNRNTVVIGRNQNAWKECRTELLETEGGKLARRSSGGGAVYHDLGNLNFTFLLPRKEYDLARQFAVLQRAVSAFGVQTEISGRNDVVLTDGGAKFSGNAFRFSTDMALHHGTVLIDADMEKLSRYLAPSKRKLAAKGIESVRSRVCNLAQVNSAITVPAMRAALEAAFTDVYGKSILIDESEMDTAAIAALTGRYASWDWRYGKTPRFTASLENRFAWGEISMLLMCGGGYITECTVYSDAMDENLPALISSAMKNAPYSQQAMAERIRSIDGMPEPIRADLADWLANQSC